MIRLEPCLHHGSPVSKGRRQPTCVAFQQQQIKIPTQVCRVHWGRGGDYILQNYLLPKLQYISHWQCNTKFIIQVTLNVEMTFLIITNWAQAVVALRNDKFSDKLSILSLTKLTTGLTPKWHKLNYVPTLSHPVKYGYQFKNAALPKTRLAASVSNFYSGDFFLPCKDTQTH